MEDFREEPSASHKVGSIGGISPMSPSDLVFNVPPFHLYVSAFLAVPRLDLEPPVHLSTCSEVVKKNMFISEHIYFGKS